MGALTLEGFPGPQEMAKLDILAKIKEEGSKIRCLSPSGTNDLDTCSMKFKFTRIDKRPTLDALPLVYGNMLHDALEVYMKGVLENKVLTWDNVITHDVEVGHRSGVMKPYKEAWFLNEGHKWQGEQPTAKLLEREFGRLEDSFHSFTENLASQLTPVFAECFLALPVPSSVNLVANGYVDLGAIYKGEFHILDYKTAKAIPEKSKNTGDYEINSHYRQQLAMYSGLLYNWKLPTGKQKVGLIYISKCDIPVITPIFFEITQKEVDTVASKLIKYNVIIEEDLFMTNRSYSLCSAKFCSFHEDCHEIYG